jgi:NADPH2:quinone reductase
MTKVVRIHEFGGSDVLSIEDDDIGAPGPGEVLLDQKGMALHYADTMLREGKYFLKPELPAVVGLDGAGVVEAVGDGVTDFKPGDTACYMFNLGAYAEKRVIAADALMPVPDGIDPKNLAGTFLRGMTAQYLLRQTYRVQSGDTVLVHTAAGGMGTLLCQWAKALGATVIGTVGSDDKKAVAAASGAAHVVNSRTEDIAAAVNDITGGEGVAAVYDGIGKDVWDANVAALRPTGYLVNYGHMSGPLDPIDPMQLNSKSLFFAKVSLPHFMRTPEAKRAMAEDVFAAIADGILDISVSREYKLDDIVQAQEDLVARKTTGSVIIVP